MRIAINGMGRIGRLLFRRLVHCPGIAVVAVNDTMDPHNLAYLVNYASVYGTMTERIAYDKYLVVEDQSVECLREPEPLKLPWKNLEVDIVLECTGQFITKKRASQHLRAGAKKVLL